MILTTFDLDECVYAALRARASGFLLKDVLPADLLAGVRHIVAGEGAPEPRLAVRVVAVDRDAADVYVWCPHQGGAAHSRREASGQWVAGGAQTSK